MKTSNKRFFIAIIISVFLTVLNIITVSIGSTDFIYMKFEELVLNNDRLSHPSANKSDITVSHNEKWIPLARQD